MNRLHEIADELAGEAGQHDPNSGLNLELAIAHLRAAARLADGISPRDRSNQPDVIHQDVVKGWHLQKSLQDPKGYLEKR